MKRLVLLLNLLAAPVAAQQVSIPHTTFTLPNGLRVIVAEDHSAPVAAVNVWYHVGSGYERPGRTGFAHLFEHIMFEGSKNVPEGDFDNWLEAAGAWNNGSTNNDRTNYFEVMPSNAVELALWLEADRMGGLLDAMSPGKLEGQRGVVKNERRQSYENQPYGLLWEAAPPLLYPEGHPYSWTTIGSMADLDAAQLDDVSQFFRTYYAPNNASIAIVGDVNPQQVRQWVERYFGWIPRGADVQRPTIAQPALAATTYTTREDRVTLPELTMFWRTGPRFSQDEAAINALAAILTDGKSARLYKRLVYDEQVATFTQSLNEAQLLSGDLMLRIRARPDVDLDRIEAAMDEEIAKLAAAPPSREELDRVVNGMVTGFVGGLETVQGKADRLNDYLYYAGNPGYSEQDLARYRALTPAHIQRAAQQYLAGKNHVIISIVPQGKTELAAQENQ
ncbi:MAG TPA: pitrilysin family protein [Longimicrobium sp.]|jgi:zinc protease|uniref:M16 family metallopeptidase n=1 Tax=Longimicrobium sp. TaxID=2029185 RepID=UPI002EDB105A